MLTYLHGECGLRLNQLLLKVQIQLLKSMDNLINNYQHIFNTALTGLCGW